MLRLLWMINHGITRGARATMTDATHYDNQIDAFLAAVRWDDYIGASFAFVAWRVFNPTSRSLKHGGAF